MIFSSNQHRRPLTQWEYERVVCFFSLFRNNIVHSSCYTFHNRRLLSVLFFKWNICGKLKIPKEVEERKRFEWKSSAALVTAVFKSYLHSITNYSIVVQKTAQYTSDFYSTIVIRAYVIHHIANMYTWIEMLSRLQRSNNTTKTSII